MKGYKTYKMAKFNATIATIATVQTCSIGEMSVLRVANVFVTVDVVAFIRLIGSYCNCICANKAN